MNPSAVRSPTLSDISVREDASSADVSVSLYSWGWTVGFAFSCFFFLAGWNLMTTPQPLRGGGQSNWTMGLVPVIGGLWLSRVSLLLLAGRSGVRMEAGRCTVWTSVGPIRWWRGFSADDFREIEFYWTGRRGRTPAARIHTHSGKRIAVTMPDDKQRARRYLGAIRRILTSPCRHQPD